jgi:hypothetical protein
MGSRGCRAGIRRSAARKLTRSVEIAHSRDRDGCKRAGLPALLELQRGARLLPALIAFLKNPTTPKQLCL